MIKNFSCLIPSYLLTTFASIWYTTLHIQPVPFVIHIQRGSRGRVSPSGPWLKILRGLIRAKTWLPKAFFLCSESKCLVLVKGRKRRVSIESNRESRVLLPWDNPLMCFSSSLQENQGQQIAEFKAGLYFSPSSRSVLQAFTFGLSRLLCNLFRFYFPRNTVDNRWQHKDTCDKGRISYTTWNVSQLLIWYENAAVEMLWMCVMVFPGQ